MQERTEVIATIKKLSMKTVDRGCTEAEAMSAMSMIGKLLKVYNLSIDEVYLEQTNCIKKEIKTDSKNASSIHYCVVAIASFCDCKVWRSKTVCGNSYFFFGMEPDVEMAEYLYHLIDTAIKFSTAQFKKSEIYKLSSSKKSASSSFGKGMANRIYWRLMEMKRENIFAPPTGRDMVLVKNNKVQSEFDKLSMNLVYKKNAGSVTNYSSYRSGCSAGDSVNLNRPITNSSTTLLLC